MQARRSDLWTAVWAGYFRWLFTRRFAALWVDGELPAQGPLVLAGNHTSWWDGPLGMMYTALYSRHRGYVGMEWENLARYSMFRRAGCFGVARGEHATAVQAIHYAADLLANPEHAVWIFPQGRMRHLDERPLRFEGGLGLLARLRPGVPLVRVSFRYELRGEDRPEAFMRFDAPEPMEDDPAWLRLQEERLTTLLDRHREACARRETGRCVIAGATGVDRRWDRARALDDRRIA